MRSSAILTIQTLCLLKLRMHHLACRTIVIRSFLRNTNLRPIAGMSVCCLFALALCKYALRLRTGPSLNAYHDVQHLFGTAARDQKTEISPAECLFVVDSGFSHTTITPLLYGRPIQQAIRRVDVGGKLLTNYLKELVSIRHYNLMNEDYLVNEAKENACFVSNDFRGDLERTWKGVLKNHKQASEPLEEILIDYVLPDYNTGTKGFIRPHELSSVAQTKKISALANPGVIEDSMTLGNERFTVPELLFNPNDIGMPEAGIPETVLQSLSGLPPGLWPAMLGNVLVVGGNSKMRGLMERL